MFTYSHQYSNINNLSEYDVIENHTDNTYRLIQDTDTYYILWCQSNTPSKISGNRFILINGGVVSVDPNMSYILAAEAAAQTAAQNATYQTLVTNLTPYLPTGGTPSWDSITGKPTTFTPAPHGHSPSEVTGTAVITNDSRLSDARTPVAHNQTKSTITDFAHSHAESEITNLTTDLSGKQATLVSGTNIKTINSNSLLGSGDIVISGSGQPIGYVVLANDTLAQALATNINTQLTVTASRTLTTTVPAAGVMCSVTIVTSGTTSYTVTFGTGFKPVGTLATGTTTGRAFVVNFRSNGTILREFGRTAAMVV